MGMSAELEYLYDKEVTCPCCKNKFTVQKIRSSRLRMVKTDEDLLNHYRDINPLKYAIQVCQRCGYAASESKYNSVKPAEAVIITKHISPLWEPRELGGLRSSWQAIDTYKLALIQGNILNYSGVDIGNICLSIGWLYREQENNDEEMRFLELARDRFIHGYENDSLAGSGMDDAKLTYMIGELSRRIGDIEAARKWIAISIGLPGMKMNHALNRLARDQWLIVKDFR